MFPHRIAGQFFNRPLLLTPDATDTISKVLLSRMSEGGFEMGRGNGGGEDTSQKEVTYFPGQPNADGTYTARSPQASRFYGSYRLSEDGKTPLPFRRTDEGVAIITVVGEWVNRGGYIGASSGVMTYEGFKVQMLAAANDPATKHILLDMESPGGQAIGAFETGDIVGMVAAHKPVTAIVNGLCASAMYAIACRATRIVSIPTGISGSIGVVLAHIDLSEHLKKEGIKPTLIHAGAHKVDGNPYEALPKAVREQWQADVEDFYSLFVQQVAAGRTGMSEKAIRDTEARTFMGAEAKRIGLVDDVGSFEEVLADISRSTSASIGGHQSRTPAPMNLALPGATGRADPTADAILPTAGAAAAADVAAAAAPAAAPVVAAPAPAPAAAAPAAPVAPAPSPAAAVDHAGAERARIGAILNHEAAAGRSKLANHIAFSTTMSVEDAAGMLAASAVETPAAAAPAAPAAPAASDAASFGSRMDARTPLALEPEGNTPKATQDGAMSWDDVVASLAGSQNLKG